MCTIPIVFSLFLFSKTHNEVIFLLFMIDSAFAARQFFSTEMGFFVIISFTFSDCIDFFLIKSSYLSIGNNSSGFVFLFLQLIYLIFFRSKFLMLFHY